MTTEKKFDEHEISKAQLKVLLESVTEGIIYIDLNGVNKCNKMAHF